MPLEISRNVSIPDNEIELIAVRAQGAGGQNVNKVATRIEITWDIANSPALEDPTRELLLTHLKAKLDSEGRVRIVASDQRTQKANREAALERLRNLVTDALKPRKKRKPTKPTRASKQRRLEAKKRRGDIKRQRRSED